MLMLRKFSGVTPGISQPSATPQLPADHVTPSVSSQQERQLQSSVTEEQQSGAEARAVVHGENNHVQLSRSQRRAAKREKKLEKLRLKALEVERKRLIKNIEQSFVEPPFDLHMAILKGLVKSFTVGGKDSATPGTLPESATAAAANAEQAANEGGKAVEGLFTGTTPFVLISAKLRTVQAAELLGREEAETVLATEEDSGSVFADGGSARMKSAQLLQAAWDEECGKEAQTVFAQLAYCGRLFWRRWGCGKA